MDPRLIPTQLLYLLMSLVLVACQPFPADPSQSLAQIRERGSLRVGALYAPPWVNGEAPAQASGVEGMMMKQFADRLGVRLETHWGSGQELFDALSHNELDIVIGGLTQDNPWQHMVGLSAPYHTTRALIVSEADQPLSEELEGLLVSIERNSYLSGELHERGAKVRYVPSLREVSQGPIAAQAWRLKGLDVEQSQLELERHHHVMAVPKGENALLMELERFLQDFDQNHDLDQLLWEAFAP